jgi:hypothetical protein
VSSPDAFQSAQRLKILQITLRFGCGWFGQEQILFFFGGDLTPAQDLN